jgi:DNA polymerase V
MQVTQITPAHDAASISIPLFEVGVAAGSPSYVSEFFESSININETVVKNKNATFCVRVAGQSMVDAGIDDGDLLIVDKALEPQNSNIVLAVINGDYTVKRLYKDGADLYLQPENKNFSPIKITPFMDFRIWGVVTGLIKKFVD